jgi:NAD(P)-dependent dehydrogenase (short-subunit alcohol dehydrogenase family)
MSTPTFPLPDIDLSGRVVVMTGGDRGLGLSMAQALAAKGARLALASPDVDRLQAAAAALETASGQGCAIAVPTDITDEEDCRALVAAALARWGRLDVLFNNARRLHRGPGLPAAGNNLPMQDSDIGIYRETVLVNVVGTFLMTRAALDHFLPSGAGKVINLTTSLRNHFRPRQSPYGVTKAALESSTLIWAGDLAGTGVTVNALLPGGAADSDPDRPANPAMTLLPVDVMDPLAVWLASARSDGVTGGRFVGAKWNPALAPDDAAEAAREQPVFAAEAAEG